MVGIVQSVERLYVAQSVPCSTQGIHPQYITLLK